MKGCLSLCNVRLRVKKNYHCCQEIDENHISQRF